ncbi:GNAT family N-acetyltransferase [Luteirhabdus pelagi]|uniref:GNAT family N-acetyltransferase n=1 Tax=Luteirhabdus pelagi TaxID=2792783 RepID=UPI00193A4103|nr:GNAT family N-acetyltransferase [Luteirhabdus pelagi]
MTYKTFETERLWLRPTSTEDASFIFELLNSPKWLQYIGDRNLKSEDDAKRYIEERMLPQLKRLGYANNTVIRKTDGVKIGTCGLYDREGVEGVDIGYAFLPQFEGKGYAYEAANRLKQAAFTNFNIAVLNAYTSEENRASQRLLGKLGFTLKGLVYLPNDDKELLLFQLNRATE